MSLLGSLQARLALALGLGLVVLWMITTAITGALVQHEMDEVFDSALQETAQRILPLAVLEILNRDAESTDQRLTTLHQHEEFFTYVVRDADGRVLLRSHNAQETDFPAFEAMGFTQSETHRFYFDAALQGSITIAVAEPMTHRDKIAREALLRLGLPVLFIIPFGLIGVFWIVRRSLRPVRQFSADLALRGAARGIYRRFPKVICPMRSDPWRGRSTHCWTDWGAHWRRSVVLHPTRRMNCAPR